MTTGRDHGETDSSAQKGRNIGSGAGLESALAGVRAYVRRQARKESFIVAAAMLPVLVVLAVLALVYGAPASVSTLRLLLVAGTFAGGFFFFHRRFEQFRSDRRIAALVESSRPELRNDVRAALEFSRADAADSDVSRALRERLHARVSSRIAADDDLQRSVVPRARLDGALAAVVAAAALLLAHALFVPAKTRAAAAALAGIELEDGTNNLVQTQERAVTRPLVSTLDLQISPPAYMSLPPSPIRSSTGDFAAEEGSRVVMAGRVLEDATSLTMLYETRSGVTETAMRMLDEREFRGEFSVTGDGTYSFRIEDAEGVTVTDPISRRVRAREDAKPSVMLREPVDSMQITPGEFVDFDYTVNDDYGIAGVEFVYHFANDPDDERRLPLFGRLAELSVDDVATFDTAPLVLQPGDEIVVTIEARDNNDLSGPGVGRSRPISLSVQAPHEKNEEVLARKEELFESMLGQLALVNVHDLNEPIPADHGSASERAEADEAPIRLEYRVREPAPEDEAALVSDLDDVRVAWLSVLEKFGELVELMKEDELTPPREVALLEGSYQTLLAHERDLEEALNLARLELSGESAGGKVVSALAAQQVDHIYDTERATILIEEFIATQKAEAVSRALEELSSTRDRLRELLEQYRETNDPMLRDQIEREFRRLAERMNELLERLAEQVDELPWEHVNREAMEQSDAQQNVADMRTSMQQIEQMLNAGDIDAALAALDQMSQALDMMNQELGDPLANADPSTLSEFDRQMGEIMDEISDIEAQQAELERETSELEEQWRQEREDAMREQLDRTMREAEQLIEEARQRMEAAPSEQLSGQEARRFSEAQDALRAVAERLEAGDVALSQEAARRASSTLRDAERAMRFAENYIQNNSDQGETLRESRQASARAQRNARRVDEMMQELIEQSQAQPSPQSAERLGEMAGRQQQLEGQLGELGQQLGQLGQQFPMMEGESGETMESVGEGMQQSQRSLRGQRTGPAQQGQQQALEGLRSLRQQMQQQMSRRRQQQQHQRDGRGGSRQDAVEIPEEAQQGEDHRQRVIEAMREGTLEQFDDEIQRYYESLVE